jgi:hypothetical protein
MDFLQTVVNIFAFVDTVIILIKKLSLHNSKTFVKRF